MQYDIQELLQLIWFIVNWIGGINPWAHKYFVKETQTTKIYMYIHHGNNRSLQSAHSFW